MPLTEDASLKDKDYLHGMSFYAERGYSHQGMAFPFKGGHGLQWLDRWCVSK